VNPFIYRMLGAATIGYGVMGVYEATSRRFAELRLALVMGALFNALAIVLGVLALVSGLPPLLPITLLVAPVILSVGCVIALIRKGQ
jgi:ABC-type multidrug transport system permease subunit